MDGSAVTDELDDAEELASDTRTGYAEAKAMRMMTRRESTMTHRCTGT